MSVVGVEKEITESVYNNLHLVDGTCIEFINSQKLKRNNTSGACGIYKLKNNKYRASIGFKGKRFDCGSVDGYIEATNYCYQNVYLKGNKAEMDKTATEKV